MIKAFTIAALLALGGCGVVGTTATAGWVAAKTTAKVAVGATKIAYKGTKAGVNLARGRRADGTSRDDDGDGTGADVACPPDRTC